MYALKEEIQQLLVQNAELHEKIACDYSVQIFGSVVNGLFAEELD